MEVCTRTLQNSVCVDIMSSSQLFGASCHQAQDIAQGVCVCINHAEMKYTSASLQMCLRGDLQYRFDTLVMKCKAMHNATVLTNKSFVLGARPARQLFIKGTSSTAWQALARVETSRIRHYPS